MDELPVVIRRALISVSDKTGVVAFGRALAGYGVELLASGKTAALLRESGVEVRSVSDYTGAPEILDGRVKTLHPRVFAGILARPTPEHEAELREHDIPPIDLVVVNLYPFASTITRDGVTLAEAVEQIDIGGPSLLRAAAKNHERVTVVVQPEDYPRVLSELERAKGKISAGLREELATSAFGHTATYDAAIAGYLMRQRGGVSGTSSDPAGERAESLPTSAFDFGERVQIDLRRAANLRYGENPHQGAGFYRMAGTEPAFEQLGGKTLSYNNLVDVDAAWWLAQDLPPPSVAIIKHTNPCGAAWVREGSVLEAFRRARACDPVSAFGGIVATNVAVSSELAAELAEMFLEVVVAPEYEPDALSRLQSKKKLRILRATAAGGVPGRYQLRSAAGGVLLQACDTASEELAGARVATRRGPTEEELLDLDFAWRVCKHVKSNAIVFAKGQQLVGVGAGQMSRVDSVRLAVMKAALPLEASVAASDAFFPFADGVAAIAEAGATAVVQPGGSIRDGEVIAAADERQLAMVLTGVRHFRH